MPGALLAPRPGRRLVTLSALSIDGVAPRETVSPTTVQQLADTLKDADLAGRAVAPIGGGTQLDLGMPPTHLDLGIETNSLTRVVEYEPADLTVTVEAGMRFADLQHVLA